MNSLTIIARLFLYAAGVLVTVGQAHARDLPKTDPERLRILDAARGAEKIKFVVRDLLKDGDYAFLCALKQGADGGGIYRTDESYEVYHYAFVKEPAGWVPVPLAGEFTNSLRTVSCSPVRDGAKPRPVAGQADIQRLIVASLADRIRSDLDFGKVDEALEGLVRIMVRRKIPGTLSVEGAKRKIDATDLDLAAKNCPTEACRKAAPDAYQRLMARQADGKISSLVWNACQFGRRRFDLSVIDRCVSDMAPRRHCRPSMDFLSERADIQACLADIRALCQATMDKDCGR